MKSPELLAPAGTLNKLRYAIAYGADAVYAGMPRYSLRVRENDFSRIEQLASGIQSAHDKGKRFYLACNAIPHNRKLNTFLDDIAPVIDLAPDALIMADPGLIMLVREKWPDLPIHLSVQANTVNHAGVRFWQALGLKRIILSRELSLEEIGEIRQECPDIELEVFVHGALCIAYSGRCLLSGYFNHRDANQGTCTNSCRWEYGVTKAEVDENGSVGPAGLTDSQTGNGKRHTNSSDTYLLEERERPGELLPIEEDENGTYIMNSKDLRAIEHIGRLVSMGIDSLKIEGRTKSHYYVSRVSQVYRKAIQDAVDGREFDKQQWAVLDNLANRGYTDGFFQRHGSDVYQNYVDNRSNNYRQRFVAELRNYDGDTGLLEIETKNKFAIGDRLEIIRPAGNHSFILEHMQDEQGNLVKEVPGGGHRVYMPVDEGDYAMGLLARFV
jgi:U32 family peptidase